MHRPSVDVSRPQDALPYTRVTARGHFDTSNEVIVASRALDDTSGNDVLTPFLYADGHAVLVDRGWVPIGIDTPGDRRISPPSGEVRITAIALAGERKRPFSPDDPKAGRLRTVTHIDPARIARQVPYHLQGSFYLLLQRQRPAQHALPRYERLQPLTDGPHLSYAVQWFLFFIVGAVGYVTLLRKERARRL